MLDNYYYVFTWADILSTAGAVSGCWQFHQAVYSCVDREKGFASIEQVSFSLKLHWSIKVLSYSCVNYLCFQIKVEGCVRLRLANLCLKSWPNQQPWFYMFPKWTCQTDKYHFGSPGLMVSVYNVCFALKNIQSTEISCQHY